MDLMLEEWLEHFDKKLREFYEKYNEHQTRAFWYEFGLLHGHTVVKEASTLLNTIHRNELENAKIIMASSERLLEAQRRRDEQEKANRDPLEMACENVDRTLSLALKVGQARKKLREELLAQGLGELEADGVVDQMNDFIEMAISKGVER